MTSSSEIDMADYSAALDEIYQLRTLLAIHHRITTVVLHYKSMPKQVRSTLEKVRDDQRDAARGYVEEVLYGHAQQPRRAEQSRVFAGMPHTLTRAEWEAEVAQGRKP